MSKLIFKISRASKKRMAFAEYTSGDDVKAMAYLHYEEEFMAGLPQCIVTDDEEKLFTFLRKEELKEQKVSYNISLNESLLKGVMAYLEGTNNPLVKPTTDSNGVSLLKKFQLHVEIEPGVMAGLAESRESSKSNGNFLVLYLNAEDIKSVSIVSTKDKEYIHLGVKSSTQAKHDSVVKALFASPEVSEAKSLNSIEEVKTHISEMISSRAQRRAKNRAASKAAQAQASNSTSLVLTDNDEVDPE